MADPCPTCGGSGLLPEQVALPDENSNLISLDRVRMVMEVEEMPSLAYVEILWREGGTFAINAAIRDLEAIRRGTEDHSKPLREPETTFERQAIIRHLRHAMNHLATEWGLDEPGDAA